MPQIEKKFFFDCIGLQGLVLQVPSKGYLQMRNGKTNQLDCCQGLLLRTIGNKNTKGVKKTIYKEDDIANEINEEKRAGVGGRARFFFFGT
jgi:hypothetical protein